MHFPKFPFLHFIQKSRGLTKTFSDAFYFCCYFLRTVRPHSAKWVARSLSNARKKKKPKKLLTPRAEFEHGVRRDKPACGDFWVQLRGRLAEGLETKQARKQSRGGQGTKEEKKRGGGEEKTWIKTWGTAQWESLDMNCEANGGLADERLNTCTGTATDTHRQIRGPQPKLKMNSVTSLSHSGFSSPPCLPPTPRPLSCFRLVHKVKRAWAFSRRGPIFHPLTRPARPPSLPPTPLHFRNGRGNTSGRRTHAPRRLPRGARDRLQTTVWRHVSTTTPGNCHLEKKQKQNKNILHGCRGLVGHFHELSSAGKFPRMQHFRSVGFICTGGTWKSRETRR